MTVQCNSEKNIRLYISGLRGAGVGACREKKNVRLASGNER